MVKLHIKTSSWNMLMFPFFLYSLPGWSNNCTCVTQLCLPKLILAYIFKHVNKCLFFTFCFAYVHVFKEWVTCVLMNTSCPCCLMSPQYSVCHSNDNKVMYINRIRDGRCILFLHMHLSILNAQFSHAVVIAGWTALKEKQILIHVCQSAT